MASVWISIAGGLMFSELREDFLFPFAGSPLLLPQAAKDKSATTSSAVVKDSSIFNC
jgi:hypothetical protein